MPQRKHQAPRSAEPGLSGTTGRRQGFRLRQRILIYALVLAGALLVGFVPQYIRVHKLTRENQILAWRVQVGAARDEIGVTLLELTRNNYGLAAGHASKFFGLVRTLITDAPDGAQRAVLEQIASRQDVVIAEVAKADPAVRPEVQKLYEDMHKVGMP